MKARVVVLLSCTLLGAAVLTSAPLASAQPVQQIELPPTEQAARGHYLMGLEHYAAGRFEPAAREFSQAYDLSRRPELLYNLFLARRDAGETRAAADALRAYLEAEPDSENAELLRARLATLDAQVATEDRARAAETARASDDEEGDRAADEEAAQASVEEASIGVEAPASEPQPEGSGPWPWVLVGGGAAMVAVAAITGGVALSVQGELQSSCPERRCPTDFDYASRQSTGDALAVTTDVLGGIGIVALGVGIVWAIVEATSRRGVSEEQRAVRCGPMGCAISF